MKKVISLILATLMVMTLGLTVFADGATRDDYKAAYADYKTYYNDVYSPAYHAYNATLDEFAQRITLTEFQTLEQAERVIGFLELCKTQRDEFFGDRVTPGTSRYDVPEARNTMFAYADAKDYDNAITSCGQLTYLVEQRVGFLLGLADDIDNFVIIEEQPEEPVVPEEPADADVTADFTVHKTANSGYTYYTLIISNTTDTDITGWSFAYTYDGGNISTMYAANNTSGAWHSKGLETSTVSFSPLNKWQDCNTIPANGYVTIQGMCTPDGTGISNASFNGGSITVNFSTVID